MRALTELKKECMSRVISVTKHNSISCLVCDEIRPNRLLLHHYSYNNKSVTYNQFENSDDGRLKYYSNIIDEVKERPYNFEILCVNCHSEIESQVSKTVDIKEITTKEIYEYSHDYQGDFVIFWMVVYITVRCRLDNIIIENKEDISLVKKEFNNLFKKEPNPPCAFCEKLSTSEVTNVETENGGEDIIMHHFSLCYHHKKFNIVKIEKTMDELNQYTVTASFPMYKNSDNNLKFASTGLDEFFWS